MKERRAKIIVLSILAVILVAAGVYIYSYINRFVYNDPNLAGNTAGNINNGGLFCEYNGYIYFSNPYDDGALYRMNSDCTNARKLSDDHVAYINVDGNHIYYVRNNSGPDRAASILHGYLFGLYRCELDGSNPAGLYEKQSGTAALCGNYIYYQHYNTKESPSFTLYRAKIDGSEDVKVSNTTYEPSSYYNGRLYFANIDENHNLCSLDVNTGSISTVLEANAYMADMEGQYIYYIDMNDNYALMRYNTANRIKEKLIDGRCVHYNVYGTNVFAMIEGDDVHGIYRMNVDGSQKELIAQGDFNNISCTSQYTFFQYFNDNVTLYRVPTIGKITTIEQINVR